MLLLDRNENRLGLAPATRAQMIGASRASWRYPEQETWRLQQALANVHGQSPERVLLGAGSTSVLLAVLADRLQSGRATLFHPLPVYAPVLAFPSPLKAYPVGPTADGRIDLPRLRQRVEQHQGDAVVYLSNPDCYSGEVLPRESLLHWITQSGPRVFFIIDEAYIEFMPDHGQRSLIRRQSALPRNLLVLRSFSKAYGMAGLRVGYAVTRNARLAAQLRVPLATGMNLPGVMAACDALEDAAWLEHSRFLLEVARSALLEGLSELGIATRHGPTNFVLHEVPCDLSVFRARLHEQSVRLAFPQGELSSWCRVSVDCFASVQAYLTLLRSVCG
ncbi:MAG: histidinol-phosphate aminotransferase family protein [Paludibacterium sp.]|uniref:pyridoxal phosphate-dependent aminotransferase n=1 Tax=Paludibacterium sp. TaxID=1917523 RepID=UPI0025F075C4|nr:aminotransferase class I/II-fold pyridoxal phosphate-dependent enzyme [Paludibacterium sp.]MBV8047943.1 histidinol-phosphate aminotransferase family protein [Paludibacterium sp.]MBV8647220.1 histidinol-phosphate aminotransferase family protein [Paludibacterium sp.]